MPDDKGQQVKLYLVIVLALLAAVIGYFRFLHNGKDSATTIVSPPAKASGVDVYTVEKTKPQNVQRSRLNLIETLDVDIRDIFAPVKLPEKTQTVIQETSKPAQTGATEQRSAPMVLLELKGTIIGGNMPMAIINDKFVRLGEKVGDYQVIDITSNMVYLRSGGHEKVIKVITPAE